MCYRWDGMPSFAERKLKNKSTCICSNFKIWCKSDIQYGGDMMSYNIKEPILLVNSELITDLGLSINEMVDHLKVVNKENYKTSWRR